MDQIGRVNREYRERAGMTQSELAARWPRHARFGGGEGVSWKYIQDIEQGRKHIEDQATLPKVCALLTIPLWCVGLSEYDPLSGPLSSASPFTRCGDLLELPQRGSLRRCDSSGHGVR
jgi:transcriptional regulator with XRE-family HTH domain